MTDKQWLAIVAIASALKLLFIPAYRSTDFEVHRNWLAITHSLPIDRWYFESTSEWTLDYPPFFAWFEWLLSIVASRVDPAMLVVSNLNYASNACIVFQRVSVIVADFVLAFATRTYCSTLGVSSSRRAFTLAVLILLNAGLLIVDHIHFQYNGLLLGLLLLSIARLKQERVLEGAFWFAILLNMKHIFLYVAPAYILYLFRSYCFQDTQRQTGWLPRFSTFLPSRLLRLGAIVTAVFAVSFGPFIAMGQLPQVMSRLFPLKRGLTHAYWAPNVWALYNFADKTTSMLTRSASSRPSTTGGLVGDVEHVVLPSVPPIAALLLTTVSILPGLVASWRRPGNFRLFLRGLVACAYGSFLFGWHVHEKAILLVIVPLSLLAVENVADARNYLVLSITGIVSLFPLLIRAEETPIKVALCLAYYLFSNGTLPSLFRDDAKVDEGREKFAAVNAPSTTLLTPWSRLYLCGLALLECFCTLAYPFTGLADKLPFLPLMAISVYCAGGVCLTWALFYRETFAMYARSDSSKTE